MAEIITSMDLKRTRIGKLDQAIDIVNQCINAENGESKPNTAKINKWKKAKEAYSKTNELASQLYETIKAYETAHPELGGILEGEKNMQSIITMQSKLKEKGLSLSDVRAGNLKIDQIQDVQLGSSLLGDDGALTNYGKAAGKDIMEGKGKAIGMQKALSVVAMASFAASGVNAIFGAGTVGSILSTVIPNALTFAGNAISGLWAFNPLGTAALGAMLAIKLVPHVARFLNKAKAKYQSITRTSDLQSKLKSLAEDEEFAVDNSKYETSEEAEHTTGGTGRTNGTTTKKGSKTTGASKNGNENELDVYEEHIAAVDKLFTLCEEQMTNNENIVNILLAGGIMSKKFDTSVKKDCDGILKNAKKAYETLNKNARKTLNPKLAAALAGFNGRYSKLEAQKGKIAEAINSNKPTKEEASAENTQKTVTDEGLVGIIEGNQTQIEGKAADLENLLKKAELSEADMLLANGYTEAMKGLIDAQKEVFGNIKADNMKVKAAAIIEKSESILANANQKIAEAQSKVKPSSTPTGPETGSTGNGPENDPASKDPEGVQPVDKAALTEFILDEIEKAKKNASEQLLLNPEQIKGAIFEAAQGIFGKACTVEAFNECFSEAQNKLQFTEKDADAMEDAKKIASIKANAKTIKSSFAELKAKLEANDLTAAEQILIGMSEAAGNIDKEYAALKSPEAKAEVEKLVEQAIQIIASGESAYSSAKSKAEANAENPEPITDASKENLRRAFTKFNEVKASINNYATQNKEVDGKDQGGFGYVAADPNDPTSQRRYKFIDSLGLDQADADLMYGLLDAVVAYRKGRSDNPLGKSALKNAKYAKTGAGADLVNAAKAIEERLNS